MRFFFSGNISVEDDLFVATSADAGFFCNVNYMPIFANNFTFPNASFEAAAREICEGNSECLFDSAATLSTEFGQATLNNSAEFQSDNEVIGKKLMPEDDCCLLNRMHL